MNRFTQEHDDVKRLTAIEWIVVSIVVIVTSLVVGGVTSANHWERCRQAGGYKRYVGSTTGPEGATTAVYECLDRNGRFIDVD